ncbi:MAG: bifunctional adenosylcobinamide kinase/adenosylcobinamide-phosphate guanylyltransferase [Anaerolineales bacterium]
MRITSKGWLAEMGELIVILGGARSGKSNFAERLALARGHEDVLYIATSQALDEEMAERIARHRAARPTGWRTIEEPLQPSLALSAAQEAVVVLDCMTVLVSNLLLTQGDPEQGAALPDADVLEAQVEGEVRAILAAAGTRRGPTIVVSNEVGLGLVPPYPLGRIYRDVLGRANRLLVEAASVAYLLIAGLPIDLKRLSALDDPLGEDRGQP